MTDSFLDDLGTRLCDAERDLVARAEGERARRRRRRRAFGAGAIVVPLVAASAWAASGLLPEGSDVPYPAGAPVSGKGVGTVVPGSARMLVSGVPDPEGGPSWGLRTFRTSRGLVCLQVGREQDGKLGQIGRFGAFGNDGRFHELRPGVVESEFQCGPPDGAGVGFLTMHSDAQSASGGVLTCGAPGGPTCRSAQRRAVDYGLLGPKATSITVRPAPAARTKTVRTHGAEGAYLVVGRRVRPAGVVLRSGRTIPGGDSPGYSPGFTPASPVITRVRYGAAATCVLAPIRFGQQNRLGLRGGCPDPPGFTPIPKPSAAGVRATVVARARPGRGFRVRFIARRAVRDRLSGYNVLVVFPGGHSATGSTTDRDLQAGQTVVKNISIPNRRPGRYEVIVSYATQAARPLPGPLELQSLRLRLRPRPGGGITGYERGVVVGRTTVVVR